MIQAYSREDVYDHQMMVYVRNHNAFCEKFVSLDQVMMNCLDASVRLSSEVEVSQQQTALVCIKYTGKIYKFPYISDQLITQTDVSPTNTFMIMERIIISTIKAPYLQYKDKKPVAKSLSSELSFSLEQSKSSVA